VPGKAIALLGAGVAVLTSAASSAGKPTTSETSRAGGTIAFVRAGRLAFMNGDGGSQRITAARVTGYPTWSRDGNRLAFFSTGPKARLYVARADGTGRRAATPEEGFACGWLDWSPNGRRIAYTLNDDCGGGLAVFAVNRDGTHRRRLTRGWDSFDATWSPNGRRILFARFISRANDPSVSRLLVLPAEGSNPKVLPRARVVSTDGSPRRPAAVWSRDGKKIFFIGSVEGHDDMTLAVIDADGANLRDVTPGLNRVFSFSFSPSGAEIAVAADDGRRRDIYVLRPDGGDVRKLTDVRGVINNDPQWSSDGNRIAFTRRLGFEGNDQIYVMNADGTDQRNLSRSTFVEYAPAWRPRH
jgi:TolB protein